MDATAVIDSYINNIAARLPRSLRNDVGLELRSLLNEQLSAAAADRGSAADEQLAIEVVRGFGPPEVVAARYSPRGFQLIEPEYAPVFVKLATACVVIQWALTLPSVFAARTTVGEWWKSWGIGAFAWVGVLVIWFGLATWVRRRAPVNTDDFSRPWTHYFFWLPVASDWRPVDHDAIQRRVERGALPLGVLFTIFFMAPAWFLGLTGANTAWAQYDESFGQRLLPALLALMVVRLVLCAAAGFSARWRAQLETLRFSLWAGFIGILAWTLLGWDIFASPLTDTLFKAWLSVFLLVNLIQIVLRVRRDATRVRVPKQGLNVR